MATYIPGKDEALERSIETLRSAIESLGFSIVEARWLNPAPYIWSVHIRDRDCPQVFSNGKGASREAAMASALGEMLERLSTRYLWADFYLTPVLKKFGFIHQANEKWFAAEEATLPESVLDKPTRERYNLADTEEGELLLSEIPDINGGDSLKGICTLPYVRQSDGETVLFPVNVIANLFVSNGMSAGNNRDEAVVQGLSEIFERGIKNRILSEGIALPRVPEDVIARYPHIQAGLEALNEAGFPVRALDASLGGRYPVMCVLLQNPQDGGVYASFGAHPRFGVALERALTELLQGRALDELEGFPAPTSDIDLVRDPHNLELHFIDSSGYVYWSLLSETPDIDFADWDDTSDNAQARAHLIELLREDGHDVYISEHTELGAYACRILVPGFSEIYLPDELRWNNNNQTLEHRATLFDLNGAEPEAWEALLEDLESFAVNEQMRVLEWAGIVGDAGTPWARLRVGELKLWLMLALELFDEAREQLNMVLASGHLSSEERLSLRALSDVLDLYVNDFDVNDFEPALLGYYGEEVLQQAKALASGETRFPGLNKMDLEVPTQAHGRLLEAYAKVLRAQPQLDG
ncbi:Ribosomal protein S12 methylthiotransferase accessory factor YcaO [Halomonadaceae bacterium LMG 33818]|uniref:30S ribosomal protein S12 methylthiotransferase accessory factor YcaO n=1 Tax=Cernens ardua TaxID=3402176 RepID=UPI003EDCB227